MFAMLLSTQKKAFFLACVPETSFTLISSPFWFTFRAIFAWCRGLCGSCWREFLTMGPQVAPYVSPIFPSPLKFYSVLIFPKRTQFILTYHCPTVVASQPCPIGLISQCYALLVQGLSSKTRRAYSMGQRCCLQFCHQLSYVDDKTRQPPPGFRITHEAARLTFAFPTSGVFFNVLIQRQSFIYCILSVN